MNDIKIIIIGLTFMGLIIMFVLFKYFLFPNKYKMAYEIELELNKYGRTMGKSRKGLKHIKIGD